MISKVFSLAIDDFCILKLSLVINMLFFSNRTLLVWYGMVATVVLPVRLSTT